MRRFALLLAVLLPLAAVAAPDLGVRCIRRAPLYWRYNVQYPDGLPRLAPTHNNQDPELDQRWPKSGETVKFNAEVRNHGDTAVSGFQYRWKIDGIALGGLQTFPGSVAPGATVTVTRTWTWPANLNDHKVTIEVDPNGLIADPYRQNNVYTDYTNALSFSIWVEQGLYDRFNLRTNGFGTKSFEDWIRWQFDAMREDFARSVYPDLAPQGILERIRIEEINVIPFDPNDLNNWRRYLDSDPNIFLNDGRWQFVNDFPTLQQKIADWDNYVNTFVTQIDWGLVHELSHQLGIIDEYRLNVDDPNMNRVLTRDGNELRTRHNFHMAGLMGGGYVLPGYDGTTFDSHTAGALNRNLRFRRGYFGEYLFDMPQVVTAQFFDGFGNKLQGARVDFYQKDKNTEQIYNTPVISGVTDSEGKFVMPNRDAPFWTTATGHTLHPNPFGFISVVGQDSTMLVKVTKSGQEDFRWLEVIQLNEAFWRGETQQTTIPFSVSIFPSNAVSIGRPVNLALNKPSTASVRADLAGLANDGDTSTPGRAWVPDPPLQGQWWQVDLGRASTVWRAIVWPAAGNGHDWFNAFHLEASLTGAFLGEQTRVPLETFWDQTRNDGDYGMQRLSGFSNRASYTFAPTRGRYFRIVSDVYQPWVQLQELELYAFPGALARKP